MAKNKKLTPKQLSFCREYLANGVAKAVSEAADLAYQAGSLYLRLPDAAFGTHLERDKKTWLDEIPSLQPFEDPQSTTGKLMQSAVQFLAGFAGRRKSNQGAGRHRIGGQVAALVQIRQKPVGRSACFCGGI